MPDSDCDCDPDCDPASAFPATLSGSHVKATGFAGGYLIYNGEAESSEVLLAETGMDIGPARNRNMGHLP
jgi:hypothetical protein